MSDLLKRGHSCTPRVWVWNAQDKNLKGNGEQGAMAEYEGLFGRFCPLITNR